MAGKHLYIIQSRSTGAIKIGKSDDPERRLLQLQTGSPYSLRIILVGLEKGNLELKLHRLMVRHRTRQTRGGEWFTESGMGDIPTDIWGDFLPWYLENPDWWKV